MSGVTNQRVVLARLGHQRRQNSAEPHGSQRAWRCSTVSHLMVCSPDRWNCILSADLSDCCCEWPGLRWSRLPIACAYVHAHTHTHTLARTHVSTDLAYWHIRAHILEKINVFPHFGMPVTFRAFDSCVAVGVSTSHSTIFPLHWTPTLL